MAITMRPTGSTRTGLTTASLAASGRSGAFIRPAGPTVCAGSVHERQRPDDALRSRGDLGRLEPSRPRLITSVGPA
jgi:hypothetical protein